MEKENFPGDPVVKNLHCQDRGHRFNPCLSTQGKKERERRKKKIIIEVSLILVCKDIFIFVSVNLEMKNT